jgi:hypothetical protein
VLYSYAENDFDTPVTVTDGVHTTQVLAKTSFVRTEMPAGPQTVSAWIDTIPGWIAAVSVTCVGSDVHYVALRQHDGLVDAKLQEASKGKIAIAERFLVNRLVAAQPSVAPKPKSETAWTNCTSTDPCHQLAVLDGAKGLAGMSSIAGEDGQIHAVENGTHAPHLLHPGRYTVLSYSPSRSDTFDLAAGHRYRLVNQWHYFGGAATSWFEDVATKRVVAGAKWCTSAADCPESSCSKGSKDSPAVCDIPELQCSTWRTGLGDDRPGHCAPRSGLRQADR